MPIPKNFQSLKAEWYQKLKDAGFDDIEQDENYLKRWTSAAHLRGKHKGRDFETVLRHQGYVQDYFRLTKWFLHDYKFESTRLKLIWHYHSNGMPYRDIAVRLKSFGINLSASTIQSYIYRLEKKMLAKYDQE